jgi:hypothetical protein
MTTQMEDVSVPIHTTIEPLQHVQPASPIQIILPVKENDPLASYTFPNNGLVFEEKSPGSVQPVSVIIEDRTERRNEIQEIPSKNDDVLGQYFSCATCNHYLHHSGIPCQQLIPNTREFCACSDVCGTQIDHAGRLCNQLHTVSRNLDVRSWLYENDIHGWGIADTIGPAFVELVSNDFKYVATLTHPDIPFDSWMKTYCGSWDEEQNKFIFDLCKTVRDNNNEPIHVHKLQAHALQLHVYRKFQKNEYFHHKPHIRYQTVQVQQRCQCVRCTCANCVPQIPCSCVSCQCKDCADKRPHALRATDLYLPYGIMTFGILVLLAGIILIIVLPSTLNPAQVWIYLMPVGVMIIGLFIILIGFIFALFRYRKLPSEFYRGTLRKKDTSQKKRANNNNNNNNNRTK